MQSTAGLACNTTTNVADFSEDASAITPLLVGTEQPHQANNDEEGTPTLSHLMYNLT